MTQPLAILRAPLLTSVYQCPTNSLGTSINKERNNFLPSTGPLINSAHARIYNYVHSQLDIPISSFTNSFALLLNEELKQPTILISKQKTLKLTDCHVPTDWKYCVIQCTGYLKSWAPAKFGLDEQDQAEADGEVCNLSCLVAVGRLQAPLAAPASTPRRLRLRAVEFVSRHAMDGKFLFVDQRLAAVASVYFACI